MEQVSLTLHYQEDESKSKAKIKSTREKINQYIESSTIHGLTRSILGTKIESIVWCFILFCAIVLSIGVIANMVRNYLKFEINSVFRHKIARPNHFPSLRICEEQLFYNSYLEISPQNQSIERKSDPLIKIDNKILTNSMFNITHCFSWDSQNCLQKKYFKSLSRYNNSCIEFNPDGTFADLYNHVNITFDFNKPKHLSKQPIIFFVASDPRLFDIDIGTSFKIMPSKNTKIVLDKTSFKRLPAPYTSSCSEDKSEDMFPGKYSRWQCIESKAYSKIYEKCGAIYDFHKQYMSEEFLEKYKIIYKNESKRKNCIKRVSQQRQRDYHECHIPCDEIIFKTSISDIDTSSSHNQYSIELSYHSGDTYTIIEEIPRIKLDQLFSEIGGFLGLVIGASIISIFEIFACLIMKITNINREIKLKLNEKKRKLVERDCL